jgi:hypothetical protein
MASKTRIKLIDLKTTLKLYKYQETPQAVEPRIPEAQKTQYDTIYLSARFGPADLWVWTSFQYPPVFLHSSPLNIRGRGQSVASYMLARRKPEAR